MAKKIALGLGALVLLLILVVALQPAAFRIERSAQIAAPPAVVYGIVSDFHEWPAWSPWAKLDPNMKTTYSGAPKGEGAQYAWQGNDQVGSGRMQIVRAEEPSALQIKLDFIAPMQQTNITDFHFAPSGDGTQVSWAMSGENGFFGKAFSMVMDMDELVGSDFEKGLAALKQEAEAKAKQ
ncbi:MAG TPA: SRPBCC family protein [Polyangiales bacterium]|nr:SRPBCC family protein [Polyangiales bacterium]